MKSALIVDDHPVVRAAIRIVLQAQGFTQIHEASSGNEVVPLILKLDPHLLVLDLGLGSMGGLEVLARIQIKAPTARCRVLVFSMHEPMHYQERCLRAGARGYVTKSNQLTRLREAINAVMSGHTYFSALPNGMSNAVQRTEKEMIDHLSDRELCIFVQLALGKPNKAIAEEMHLSHKTVSTYKTRMMAKLCLGSSVLLRDFAKRNHLI
ncbi:response regulator transcription factor [Pseudomonas sp. SWRI153]|uniref:Response regulator transcription factor n=1 Tax=Pseudomonas khorasanensis TaxID=2745508 RepID=A0A923F4T6_9PSED|nr:response regulator transcription factor [Pseudomonas khorasanensis]MBV4487226.1 response regulator transcription factor [Pseudomonas khorasanensis]